MKWLVGITICGFIVDGGGSLILKYFLCLLHSHFLFLLPWECFSIPGSFLSLPPPAFTYVCYCHPCKLLQLLWVLRGVSQVMEASGTKQSWQLAWWQQQKEENIMCVGRCFPLNAAFFCIFCLSSAQSELQSVPRGLVRWLLPPGTNCRAWAAKAGKCHAGGAFSLWSKQPFSCRSPLQQGPPFCPPEQIVCMSN